MRIAVLGGDGFVGWPTALHLSSHGHTVAIVDNLSRRWIDAELGVQSLTPVDSIQERLRVWEQVSGAALAFERIDVAAEYDRFKAWVANWRPEAVIHFAEQRAAPYSMKSDRHKTYTVNNNVNATHNLLNALVATATDAHVVHLGTMGVYGYSAAGASIPEGYLNVEVALDDGGKTTREILHPTDAGSIYHMTKCLDQLLFAFYAKNDGLRITDLHQGVVWGTDTAQTRRHRQLVNRFDYDGDYGTVLNRFLVQAALGHPLTVHGTGGQKRAFIHIQDSVRCVELALANPPAGGEKPKIFNQMTEVHRVRDLANLVSSLTGAELAFLPNPRKEAPENELSVRNGQFLALGLEPVALQDGLLTELVDVARKYLHRVDRTRIPSTSAWTREIAPTLVADVERGEVAERRSNGAG